MTKKTNQQQLTYISPFGNVIYIGLVCKTVAPVFRVGYLIASKDFVETCAQLRKNID